MSSTRRRRPSAATILSLLALFAALGGSAYAAARITGASVKNNSLSGKDIRDRSVGARDLRANALRPGPAGPAGPRGPQGAPGAARALQRVGPRATLEGLGQTIVTVRLPAGSWTVTAAGLLSNSEGSNNARGAECLIDAAGATLASTGNMSVAADINGAAKSDTEHFAITGVLPRSNGGTVALVCDRAGPAGTAIENPSITAVEVGSINTESGDRGD